MYTEAVVHSGVYCTCRLPESYDSRMIECEECQKWFHFKCMGLTSEPDTWVCQQCHEKTGTLKCYNCDRNLLKALMYMHTLATYTVKKDVLFCTLNVCYHAL